MKKKKFSAVLQIKKNMITCIDKKGNEFVADFTERKGGDITCQVFNKETNECVDSFRISAEDLGYASKEMIAQKHTYEQVY